MIPNIITTATITFYIGGTPYTIDRESPVAQDVISELKVSNPDADRLRELADFASNMANRLAEAEEAEEAAADAEEVNYLTKGVIAVSREGVTFNGEPVHNALADRLIDILSLGLRIGPYIRFAENVYQNPAEYARAELMEWLEGSDLPITEDGCFLAYKVVRDDFTDVHTGKFDNSPGQVVQLKGRSSVDPNRNNTCSHGLHFCSKEYLPFFGSNQSGRRVVLVKVNPADVVSIPVDYNYTKGRTWRYEVMEEITDKEQIPEKIWNPIVWDAPEDDDFDDWDDADEYDFDLEDDEPDTTAEEVYESHTIVELRRKASALGMNSHRAWKVADKMELARFVANNG